MKSPATTIALFKLDAVVGMKDAVETIDGKDALTRVGVTCAICDSTLDNAFAAGIGNRLDGWPNRDLDPGAIIALSPAVPASAKTVYNAWGKGKFDPRFSLDGINGPQVITPAYGLRGIRTGIGTSPSRRWEAKDLSPIRESVSISPKAPETWSLKSCLLCRPTS